MSDWSFARVWDAIADAAPEREAVVCGATRRTFGELEHRAARLATWLLGRGRAARTTRSRSTSPTGPSTSRPSTPRCKLGAVPVNVNYRYGAEEIRYLLDDSDAKVVVTEPAFAKDTRKAAKYLGRRLGKKFAPARARDRRRATRPRSPRRRPTTGGATRPPSGDDLIFLYTGGTTGMPKGVMWRNDDLYVALWQMGRPGTEPPDPRRRRCSRASAPRPRCRRARSCTAPACSSRSRRSPAAGPSCSSTRSASTPRSIWSEVERNAVQILTIVGDVFARPLLAALDAEPDRWDLSSLRAITSSGVTWSPEVKRGAARPPARRDDARLARRVRGADEPVGGEGRATRRSRRPASR